MTTLSIAKANIELLSNFLTNHTLTPFKSGPRSTEINPAERSRADSSNGSRGVSSGDKSKLRLGENVRHSRLWNRPGASTLVGRHRPGPIRPRGKQPVDLAVVPGPSNRPAKLNRDLREIGWNSNRFRYWQGSLQLPYSPAAKCRC